MRSPPSSRTGAATYTRRRASRPMHGRPIPRHFPRPPARSNRCAPRSSSSSMPCLRAVEREDRMLTVAPKLRARTRLSRAGSGIALAVWLLVACSSSPKVVPADLRTINSPLPIQVAWRVKVGDGRRSFMQPALLQNAVFAASTDGDLFRIDPGDGKVVWRVRAPTRRGAGVGADGVVVAVAGQRGEGDAYA